MSKIKEKEIYEKIYSIIRDQRSQEDLDILAYTMLGAALSMTIKRESKEDTIKLCEEIIEEGFLIIEKIKKGEFTNETI